MTLQKLYYICNKYKLYTNGDNKAYENLLLNCDKMSRDDIILNLYLHSSNYELEEIEDILEKEIDL